MPTSDKFPPTQGVRSHFAHLAVRRPLIRKMRDALVYHQTLQVSRLHKFVELTQLLFEAMHLTEPTGMSTTPLIPKSIALMKKAGIDLPKEMNPLGLYQVLSRRLLVLEQDVALVGLEVLRYEIQLGRMGFYGETGLFLRAQAQVVMGEYHMPEFGLGMDTEDDIYPRLEQVVDNPITRP